MQSVRESMLLPAVVLIIGVTLLFILLLVPDGADSARVEQAAYPFPCLYLPVIKQEAIDAGQIETDPSQISPAASYPPPGGPCGQRLPKWIYMPIIRR